jgi:hypothetical protein
MAEEVAVVSVIVVEAGDPPDGVTLSARRNKLPDWAMCHRKR